MSAIPLHDFRYHPQRPLPCEIGRLDQMPPAAQAAYSNRHTFYEIFWIVDGAGSHVIDFTPYPIRPFTLYFVAPGQIHFWQIERPVSGYALLFAPEFFQQGTNPATMLDQLSVFRPGAYRPTLALEEPLATEIDQLVQTMLAEYTTAQFGCLTMLQALAQMLLIQAERLLIHNEPQHTLTAAARLTRDFLRLVEQHYAQEHAVASYAAQLGVTPGHLSDTVRLTLGRPASTVIRERCVLEAKRLLAHSQASIATIAQQLAFADPSYFARFFRRATGQTPQAFRATFRDLYQNLRNTSLV
jgi:AraC-like DNA-binding protein